MARERITVTVINWDKHNPRKDIKHPTWFALSNRILEDPDFYDFTDGEWKALMYLFCQASQKNSPTVTIVAGHADRICGIKPATLTRTLDKLAAIGCVQIEPNPRTDDQVDEPTRVRARTESVRDTTLQDTTEQNTTRQDTTGESDLAAAEIQSPVDLAKLWNEEIDGVEVFADKKTQLPSVDIGRLKPSQARYKSAGERIRENSSRAYWLSVIGKITASEGCRGRNDRQWLADFDFLVRPDTHAKALEGKYDLWGLAGKKAGRAPPDGSLQRKVNADQEIQDAMNEVMGDAS